MRALSGLARPAIGGNFTDLPDCISTIVGGFCSSPTLETLPSALQEELAWLDTALDGALAHAGCSSISQAGEGRRLVPALTSEEALMSEVVKEAFSLKVGLCSCVCHMPRQSSSLITCRNSSLRIWDKRGARLSAKLSH